MTNREMLPLLFLAVFKHGMIQLLLHQVKITFNRQYLIKLYPLIYKIIKNNNILLEI